MRRFEIGILEHKTAGGILIFSHFQRPFYDHATEICEDDFGEALQNKCFQGWEPVQISDNFSDNSEYGLLNVVQRTVYFKREIFLEVGSRTKWSAQ